MPSGDRTLDKRAMGQPFHVRVVVVGHSPSVTGHRWLATTVVANAGWIWICVLARRGADVVFFPSFAAALHQSGLRRRRIQAQLHPVVLVYRESRSSGARWIDDVDGE